MQIQTLLNLLSDSMLGKTIVKFSTELVKNRRFLFLTFLYVVLISVFEQDPTMCLFYFVLEGFVFSLIGFITGMFKMDGVDLFLTRLGASIILLPLNIFFLIVPLAFLILFNNPEYNVVGASESEELNALLKSVYNVESWEDIITLLKHLDIAIIFFLISVSIFFVADLSLDYKKDVMDTGAFKATKYTSILSLVFLLGILPAMILGLFFEGSFSFILLIVVRVVFDSIFKNKKTTTAVEGA